MNKVAINRDLKAFVAIVMLVAVLLASPAYGAEVANVSRTDLAEYAASDDFLGIPYSWGGTTTAGFDCSGFVQFIFNEFGINLPRTTYEQRYEGVEVEFENLEPGDLVFFENYEHVGIFIGDKQFVHASSSKGIKISSLDENVDEGPYYVPRFCGARSILD